MRDGMQLTLMRFVMTEVVNDKKQLKAERKAAALAKQEAIANGTWVEPQKPKKEKPVENDEVVADDRVHLLHVYSSQVGCMAEWIKHAHKPKGTENVFYSFKAIQPLINHVRSIEDFHTEHQRLLASLSETNRVLRAKERELRKCNAFTALFYRHKLADLEHEIWLLQWRKVNTETALAKHIEKTMSYCLILQQLKETL